MTRLLNISPRYFASGAGLIFDGIQNYVSLGTMGSFGSSFGSGLYISFQIQTKTTTQGRFGNSNNSHTSFGVGFNVDQNFSTSNGKLLLQVVDELGNQIVAATSSATTFNDGNLHTITITVDFPTKVITITLDGVSQTVAYASRATLTSFANFSGNAGAVFIGAKASSGTPGNYFACNLLNFSIGVSALSLYGSYNLAQGTGTTATDGSGQGNNGTLTGSPLPTWLTRQPSDTRNVIQGLTFDGSQNYLNLGTLGNFGSSLGSGFYCRFDLSTKKTTVQAVVGCVASGNAMVVQIILNADENNTNTPGKVRVQLRDNFGFQLHAKMTTAYNTYSDGKVHTFIITADLVAKTITLTIDGNSQALTYVFQQTLSTLVNFPISIYVGARNNNGTTQQFLNGLIYNIKIGTSISTLFGSYSFQEGTGTVAGNAGGSNATLSGSPPPTWIARSATPQLTRVNPMGMNTNMSSSLSALDTRFALMAAAGVEYVRFEMTMANIEPTMGVFDYSAYDAKVDLALSYGFKIIGLLDQYGMPAWASPLGSFYAPSPSDYQTWVQNVATHYTGKISLFELGNEPNLNTYWAAGPSAVDYMALAIAGNTGVKTGNASAKTVSAGLGTKFSTDGTGIKTTDFLQTMYDNGLRRAFDYVAFHPYNFAVYDGDPAGNLSNLSALRAIMLKNNDNSSVVITEIGWTTYTGGVTEAQQATCMTTIYNNIMFGNYQYVKVCCIYGFNNAGTNAAATEDNYGIVSNDLSTLKPSYTTYQTASRQYAGVFTEVNL